MATQGNDLRLPASGHRVLVTGGCGFIGSHVVRRLARDGCRVVVLDDLSAGSREAIAGCETVGFVRGSVLDGETVTSAAGNCDLVIHLAGVVGKLLVAKDPAHVYRVSLEGTRNVMRAAPRARVVLFSSSAVYGIDGTAVAREDAHIDDNIAAAYDAGRHGYAVGKLHMERMALEVSRGGRAVLVVRPFNVVGPGQTGRYGMVIPRFVQNAVRGAPLTIYGDGTQTRSFGHVHTFVEALLRLIASPGAWEPGSNVVNVGNPRATTVLDLATEVVRQTESRSPIEFVPYESVFPGQRDVRARVPDVRRLENLAGQVPWPSLERIIGDVRASDRLEGAAPPLSSRRDKAQGDSV